MNVCVYLGSPAYMVAESSEFRLEFRVPILLTEIKDIVDFSDGFMTFDTNYGEEYADLGHAFAMLGFDVDFTGWHMELRR